MGWIVSILVAIISLVVIWRQKQAQKNTIKQQQLAHEQVLKSIKTEQAQQLDRLTRETQRIKSQGHLKLASDLLPGLDALMQAEQIASNPDSDVSPDLAKGIGMVTSAFEKALNRHGIERIAPGPGDVFDPAHHEAVSMSHDEEMENNRISASLRTGWVHETKLLRAAMVQVNKHDKQVADKAPVTFDFEEEETQEAQQPATVSETVTG